MLLLFALAFSCYQQTQAVFDEQSNILILKGTYATEMNTIDAQACKLFVGLSVIAQVQVGDIVFKSEYYPYIEEDLYFELSTQQSLVSISTYSIAVFTISTQSYDLFQQQAVNSFRIRKFDYNTCILGLELGYDNVASTIELVKTGQNCRIALSQTVTAHIMVAWNTSSYELGHRTLTFYYLLDDPFEAVNYEAAIKIFQQYDKYTVYLVIRIPESFAKTYDLLTADLQPSQALKTLSCSRELIYNITVIKQRQKIAKLNGALISINYDNIHVTLDLSDDPLTEFTQPFDNYFIEFCIQLGNQSVCLYNAYDQIFLSKDIIFACNSTDCAAQFLQMKQFGQLPKLKFVSEKNGEIVQYFYIIPEIARICTNYIYLSLFEKKLCFDFQFIPNCHIEPKITDFTVTAGQFSFLDKFYYPPSSGGRLCRQINAIELRELKYAATFRLYIDWQDQNIDNINIFVHYDFFWEAVVYSVSIAAATLLIIECVLLQRRVKEKRKQKLLQ